MQIQTAFFFFFYTKATSLLTAAGSVQMYPDLRLIPRVIVHLCVSFPLAKNSSTTFLSFFPGALYRIQTKLRVLQWRIVKRHRRWLPPLFASSAAHRYCLPLGVPMAPPGTHFGQDDPFRDGSFGKSAILEFTFH